MRKLRVAGDSSVRHLPVFAILTLQVNLPILGSLHLNIDCCNDDEDDKNSDDHYDVGVDNDLYGGIGSLVALQPGGSGRLVANETLFTLENQDWPVDQVEVEPGHRGNSSAVLAIFGLFIMTWVNSYFAITCYGPQQRQRWQRDVRTSLCRQTCRCRP